MFACDTCHPTGASYGFDLPVAFPRGTTTLGGTFAVSTGATPPTCTVGCHHPMTAPSQAITWDTAGPLECVSCHATGSLPTTHPVLPMTATRADCQSCHIMDNHMGGTVVVQRHDLAWSDRTSSGFHAFAANSGLAACKGCHGSDLAGTSAAPPCAQCHETNLPAGVTSWTRNCTMCHGGTNDASGAPPKTTWGNDSDPVRVGAHDIHVRGGGAMAAPAFDCGVCHAKPTDVFSAGHLSGGTADVLFGGIATTGSTPAWDRATATCANTYCHGATLPGGTHTAPVWTNVGQGEAACGNCHGAPPPAPHPTVTGGLTACATCHPATVDFSGALIAPSAGGKHLDGVVEALGGHPASWIDPTSPGFHAYSANRELPACRGCHGPNLDGVGGSTSIACSNCHGATWKTNCTMCHGGTNDLTGAPPKATWGNAGDPLRVGAHGVHVRGTARSPAFDCSVCHVKPTDALSAGHIDGDVATVPFGGIAASTGAVPAWDRATGTCASTYCHGGYVGTFGYFFFDTDKTVTYSGTKATPSWGGGPTSCTSCHVPTNPWHTQYPHVGLGCSYCHPDVNASGTSITRPQLHVNGQIDLSVIFQNSCYSCH